MEYRMTHRSEYTNWEWVNSYCTFSGIYALDNAIKAANEHAKTDLKHCEIGIFAMPEGASYWLHRNPRHIINRQPRPNAKITPRLAGLVNSVNSDLSLSNRKG